MTYRKSGNRHEKWETWRSRNRKLLEAVPARVLISEKVFRGFATSGTSEDGTVVMSRLPDAQVVALWEFVNLHTWFDMDAILFDALNAELRSRHP